MSLLLNTTVFSLFQSKEIDLRGHTASVETLAWHPLDSTVLISTSTLDFCSLC